MKVETIIIETLKIGRVASSSNQFVIDRAFLLSVALPFSFFSFFPLFLANTLINASGASVRAKNCKREL